MFEYLTGTKEFTNLSVDGTVNICMPIMGQPKPNRPPTKDSTNAQDKKEHRKVFTIRGSTAAVLGLTPIREEDA